MRGAISDAELSGQDMRTLAVRAFFKARPAAFRMCGGEDSLLSSADSINMQAGYIYEGEKRMR